VIEYEYFIGSIAIITPGRGYEVGENPVVTITGVDGATAKAYGPTMVAMLMAQQDINLLAGENVTLITKIHAVEGDVTIASKAGDMDLSANSLFISSKAGGIDIDAHGGSVALQRLAGFTNVTVDAMEGIDVLRSVMSENASITLASSNGAANVRQLNAKQDVTVSAFKTSTLIGEIVGSAGDVTARSTAGGLQMNANIVAGGNVTLEAQTFLQQLDQTGIEGLRIISEGSDRQVTLTPVPPTVTVTIAAPAAGGRAATAEAILGRRFLGNEPEGTDPIFEYFIENFEIIDAGTGYALDETPTVTIDGMPGAVARGIGPTNMRNITAGDAITMTAVDDIALLTTITAAAGDIAITSTSGDIDVSAETVFIHAVEGSVRLESGGEATIRSILADKQNITVVAQRSIDLLGEITAFEGDVSLESKAGDLDFTAADALIFAQEGSVALISLNGSILSPPVLNVGGDVNIESFNTVRLNNDVTSVDGTINVTSTSGGIELGANLVANDDSINLTAKSGVTQLGRGIASVKLLTGGRGYTTATRVTLAAPAAGGVTATARPIIGRVKGIAGVITGIQIINPGSGYGVGEEVEVTITGTGTASGASAVAYASSVLQNISAAKNVAIDAGAGITLLNTVSTLDGDISLTANVGDIDLRTETVKLSARNGSVDMFTFTGAILSPPTLHVTNNITLQSSAALTLANELTSDAGDITLRSTSGAVNLVNNLFAGDRITLDANAGILQSKGFVQAQELVVANKSALPVILGAQENNIDRFAGTSVGGITYVDADSFETGVDRVGVQTTEVSTNGALTLQAGTSSSGPLRIVGGVSAAPNQLFLSSGSAAIPGNVEYVVTNSVSNGPLSFRGTLANMIRLSNLNRARFDDAVVPQTIVFDADGYAVETITVNTTLPSVVQPVTIDGSATEGSVAIERVEITRGATGPTNGLTFAAGSAGSEVTGLSVTGFTGGAGISLLSGGTTVTDTFVGLQRNGSTIKANLVGVDISGSNATGNFVGSGEADDANVIGGNTFGVRVRNRASENVIVGNYIGVTSSNANVGNTTAGVLITAATSTLVSDNLISNNSDGVRLNAATATAATANRIEANTIVGNSAGAGVRVTASSFAIVGGTGAGNKIGNNGVGVVISGGATSNTVASNYIGTDDAGADLGNLSDGVQVVASIGNTIGGVTSDDGNVVANNGGSGIVIRNSAARSAALGNKVFANFSTDNAGHGILVEGGAYHAIGSGEETGNTVTLNAGDGIRVQSFGKMASTQNLIRGNLVGTDTRIADIDLGNFGDGIAIVGGSANRIEQRNVVRYNAGNGVRVEASSSNFIGSDIADEGNDIRDNLTNGVVITGGNSNLLARDNVVAGNLIDRNGSGPASTTSGNGVLVSGSRTVNTAIGTRIVNGRLEGQGNEILDNAGYGVSVVNGASNVQIQGNAIAENLLGPVHIAASANANVATPVIETALLHRLKGTAAQLVVTGTVAGPIGQQLAVDIYCTPAVNVTPGTPDYGRRHVGRLTVTITEVTGTRFSATLAIDGAATGDLITATATTMSVAVGTTPDGKQIFVASPVGSTSRHSASVMLIYPTEVSSTSPTRQARRI
jgi:hypothetical protein